MSDLSPLLLALFLVPSATAAPEFGRASADAARILAARPQDEPGVRQTPDADSDVEPLEALGNFHLISSGFYRSAQPNKTGYAQLRQMGFKSILDLKGSAKQEQKDAGSSIKVISVPMSGFKAPSFREMDRALAAIATAPRPLLVHCQHGKDRTGFVVASYRVAVERMSIPAAVREARDKGCCFIAFGSLTSYLEDYGAHRRSLLPPARP